MPPEFTLRRRFGGQTVAQFTLDLHNARKIGTGIESLVLGEINRVGAECVGPGGPPLDIRRQPDRALVEQLRDRARQPVRLISLIDHVHDYYKVPDAQRYIWHWTATAFEQAFSLNQGHLDRLEKWAGFRYEYGTYHTIAPEIERTIHEFMVER